MYDRTVKSMPITHRRPFRFAVQVSKAASSKAWRELAKKVEGLGYDTIYVPDHLDDQFAPLVAVAVAAEATSTVRVGTLVLDNDFRHPVVLAKEAATLDLLSEGRFELGLGAGWMKSDYAASGIEMIPPSSRIERLAESLSIMRSLWSSGRATLHGRYYDVDNAIGSPAPFSDGGPSVLIGGGGKRILGLASREADVVGIVPSLAEGFVGPKTAASAIADRFYERLEWVRDAAGSRFDQLDLQCLTMVVQVVENGSEARAALAPIFGFTEEQFATVPVALIGSESEIAETLHERREEFGLNFVVIHEGEMEAFARIANELSGR